jgi:DNA polymerase/3'-5' exonuclease PolX
MLFKEANEIAVYLKKHMRFDKMDNYKIEIVGSVAREEDKIKDIDFLVITPQMVHNLLETLYFTSNNVTINKITDCGDRKCFVYLTVKGKSLKIDIFHAIKVDEPFALLHHIGPKSYLLRIRRLAKLKDYKLNQYGIFDRDTDKKVSSRFNSVCDIQKFLDISCRSPKQRR